MMVKLGGQPWTIALPSPGLKKTEHWTGHVSDGPEPVYVTNVQSKFIFIKTDQESCKACRVRYTGSGSKP